MFYYYLLQIFKPPYLPPKNSDLQTVRGVREMATSTTTWRDQTQHLKNFIFQHSEDHFGSIYAQNSCLQFIYAQNICIQLIFSHNICINIIYSQNISTTITTSSLHLLYSSWYAHLQIYFEHIYMNFDRGQASPLFNAFLLLLFVSSNK